MAANAGFQQVSEANWLSGFRNLLWKENNRWWGTKRWLVNLVIWLLILPGLSAFMLFILPVMAAGANPESVTQFGGPVSFGVMVAVSYLFEMGTMALAIGVIILGQDLLLDEKLNGVTEWLLSKPVSRPAYVLAKYAAAFTATLVLMTIIPAAVNFGLFALRLGADFSPSSFLGAVGIQAIHTLFYLSLIVFLGTALNNRTAILGIGLGFLFGGQLLGGIIEPLMYIFPWPLAKLSSLLMNGQALPMPMAGTAVWASLVWSFIFIIAAVWRFRKIEF